MADTKITALSAITTVDPANDVLPIVDVSDTSMALSGTTKKITTNQLLGASGTATLASATITGDLTVDTSTLKVDSTNNRVGINNATPSYAVDVLGPTTISGRFKTSGAINALYLEDSGTTPGSLYIGTSGDTFRIITGSNTRLNIDVNGNLGLGVTPSAGGGVLQLKSGITFPATQVASSDANTLDDYEEGTFTPTVRGSTTTGTGTYTTQFGRYTKVGRLVTVTVQLVWTAHTGTGNLQFANLPFVSANETGNYNGIAIAYQSNIASSANTIIYGLVEFGSAAVTVTQTPVGGGTYGLVAMDTAGEIAFTVTYYV